MLDTMTRIRHLLATTAAAAALLLTASACSTEDDPAEPAAEESAAPADDAPADQADAGRTLTAEQLVDAMAELYPLPGRSEVPHDDNGHPNDPVQVIGTEPVIVYELQTEDAAAHWAETMNGAGAGADSTGVDARQAGRFMLSWQPDYPTSAEAIDEMTAAAQELAATEQ